MADIVDAFVVSLGLDASQYEQEIAKYRKDRKDLAEENDKYNRDERDGQKKTVEGLRSIRNETAGFLLMLAGATSVAGFAKDMLTSDAATGRFAANIGMATERVSVWENALKRVGGTAQEAQSNLRALSSIFQNYKLGTDFSKRADLAYFGLTESDLADPEKALMTLNEKGQGLKGEDRALYTTRLNRLGLSDSMVTLLSKPADEFKAMLADVENLGVATDESAQAAMDLDEQLAKTAQTIQGVARPAISQLAEEFVKLTEIVRALIAPLGVVREWLDWFGSSNAAKMQGGGSYKNFWDYAGDFVGGAAGQTIKDYMGAEGTSSATSGGGGWGGSGGGGRGAWYGSGPAASGRGSTGSGARSASTVEQYFRNKGFSPAQAKGIAAAVVAEGGLGARTGGGYKGRTIGIGQLLGSRRATFLKRYGQNFTLQNELDFMYEEMHNGDGQFVGGSIKRTNDSGAVAKMMVDRFYRPAAGSQTLGDYSRAANYLKRPQTASRPVAAASNSSSVTIGTVNIQTQATDAEGIARTMHGELARKYMVVQGSSGLKP